MWALNLAYGSRVPTLYVTLDTPLVTQATRSWALLGKGAVDEVELRPRRWMLRSRRHPHLDHVQWSDTPMSPDELPDLCSALVEYWGESPRLVIVDNVGDLASERTYEGFTHAFAMLKRVAHKTRSTVVSLHHATKKNDPDEPVYLNDVEYAGDKQPDVVLGMYAPTPRRIRVEILKSRLGKARPDGSLSVDLKVDFARARVMEFD